LPPGVTQGEPQDAVQVEQKRRVPGRPGADFFGQPKSVRREIRDRDGDASAELFRLKLGEVAATGNLPPKLGFQEAMRAAMELLVRAEELGLAMKMTAQDAAASGEGRNK
jgi:hypothetical protein